MIYFLLQVFIALMLFFGHLRTTMNHNEFITTLAGIGILGGIHMFSWLVVFQFRRNLVEEMRIMARLVASAPPPPSGKYFLNHEFQTTYVLFYFLAFLANKILVLLNRFQLSI